MPSAPIAGQPAGRPCPVCGAAPARHVLDLPSVPVLVNQLWEREADALTAAVADISLVYCDTCGMLYNAAFDETLIDYSAQYENSLHFSSVFQQFASDLADRLVDHFGLDGARVAEIGCGKGEFLQMLVSHGVGHGLGIDPSYAGAVSADDRITVVADLYTGAPLDAVDFVVFRHLLEHVADPRAFLRELRGALPTDREVGFYCEVPNGNHLMAGPALWDIIYEHPSHFTPPALARLFTEAGFAVTGIDRAFGGQFAYVEGVVGGQRSRPPLPDPLDLDELVVGYGDLQRSVVAEWEQQLHTWFDDGLRVAVWGTGSKGATFLNVVPSGARIDSVIDVNPRKWGLYLPGTGQQILEPAAAVRDLPPDVVIVMNPLYEQEIRRELRRLGSPAKTVLVSRGETDDVGVRRRLQSLWRRTAEALSLAGSDAATRRAADRRAAERAGVPGPA